MKRVEVIGVLILYFMRWARLETMLHIKWTRCRSHCRTASSIFGKRLLGTYRATSQILSSNTAKLVLKVIEVADSF